LVLMNNVDAMTELIVVLRKFADDSNLGQVINTQADSEALQNCLDRLMNWVQVWGMEFNGGKCKVMNVSYKNPGYSYTMAGAELGVTKEERDIGIMVSGNPYGL
jgi:hypothetical protein